MVDVISEKLHFLCEAPLRQPLRDPDGGEPFAAEIIAPVGSFDFEHPDHLAQHIKYDEQTHYTQIVLTLIKLYDIIMLNLVNSIHHYDCQTNRYSIEGE